jgi:hypothetical protein
VNLNICQHLTEAPLKGNWRRKKEHLWDRVKIEVQRILRSEIVHPEIVSRREQATLRCREVRFLKSDPDLTDHLCLFADPG